MKIKGVISILAALTVITSSVLAVPFNSAAETVSETEAAVEYNFDSAMYSETEDGVTYNIFKGGYAAVHYVDNHDIEEFTVPDTIQNTPVVGIEWGAFRDCKNIKKLSLGKNVSVIDWYDAAEQTIEEIAVTEDNKSFTVVDGALYSKDMKTLVAFPPASSAEEFKVSDKTEKIGDCAFVCCKNLKKVVLNDNIKEIGASAFWGCSALSDIALPNGIKEIKAQTFAGCTSLSDIDIPESVESMNDGAFNDAGCIKTEDGIYYVDNWAVGSDKDIERGDIRYGTVGTIMGLFTSTTKLKVVTVPSTVKHLSSYLVFGINVPLESITFCNDAIPDRCLVCFGLKEVNIIDPDCRIADSATSIPSYWKEVKESEPEAVKETEYVLKHSKVTSSSTGSHTSTKVINTKLFEIDEEGNILPVEGHTTQEDVDNLSEEEKERIKNSIDAINEKTEEISVRYSAPIKIGNPAKYDTIIRGFEGSTAEEYALKYRRIFDAFEPANTTVGPEIVEDTENGIVYWVYSGGYANAMISSNRAAYGKEVPKEITIPETVNNVPVKALRVIQSKSDIIHIPATVENYIIAVDSAEDGVAYYDVDKDNPYLTSVDGILYNKDMTKLIRVPSRYAGKKIVVPDGVKTIDNFAFFSLDNVESIELPDSVEVIGRCAFSASRKLETVKLSENLDILSDNAFSECTALKNVTIPESVKYVGYEAFNGTSVVKYENGLGYLDDWFVGTEHSSTNYFSGDIQIKEGTVGVASFSASGNVTIPNSVTKMSWEMIADYSTNLLRADVYSHVLDYDAFKNAVYLKDIYIYDPECEICAGDQTIRAKHYEWSSGLVGLQEVSSHKQYSDARTYAKELEEYNGRILKDTVIHGYKGSTAEAYAQMYGLKFEVIDDAEMYKNGDLNGDGQFNVGDLVLMNRYILGTYTFNEKQFKSADLNGDGNADVFDVIEFRRKILAG